MLLGKKLGMTQIIAEDGRVIPVTVVDTGSCRVTSIKTADSKDGYEAYQVGYGEVHPSKLTKPEREHLAKKGIPPLRHLKEIRGAADAALGDLLPATIFAEGDKVDVTGTSKGKGFAGVVKRYHWHGGDMTHGSMIHRKPQSGGATDAAHVFKNTGKPGHMGHETVTAKRLTIARVDANRNLLLIKGAVPGPRGGVVSVREAK
ncbi:MAG TPA: 50S ribosomal protein L3 [Armatimonadota bacterium]|jgi:large subunit ribosomal protein L3